MPRLFASVAKEKVSAHGVPKLFDLAVLFRHQSTWATPADAPVWPVKAVLDALSMVRRALTPRRRRRTGSATASFHRG